MISLWSQLICWFWTPWYKSVWHVSRRKRPLMFVDGAATSGVNNSVSACVPQLPRQPRAHCVSISTLLQGSPEARRRQLLITHLTDQYWPNLPTGSLLIRFGSFPEIVLNGSLAGSWLDHDVKPLRRRESHRPGTETDKVIILFLSSTGPTL